MEGFEKIIEESQEYQTKNKTMKESLAEKDFLIKELESQWEYERGQKKVIKTKRENMNKQVQLLIQSS